jgi:ribonuclease J
MLKLANPHYFMPVHGEYRMLKLHGQVAQQLGMPADHIFICDNGDNLVLRNHQVTRGGHVQADDVYIDGNDLDGLSSAVINDREVLKTDGMVSVLVTIDSKDQQDGGPADHLYPRLWPGRSIPRRPSRQMHAEEAMNELMQRKVTFGEIKSTIRTRSSANTSTARRNVPR